MDWACKPLPSGFSVLDGSQSPYDSEITLPVLQGGCIDFGPTGHTSAGANIKYINDGIRAYSGEVTAKAMTYWLWCNYAQLLASHLPSIFDASSIPSVVLVYLLHGPLADHPTISIDALHEGVCHAPLRQRCRCRWVLMHTTRAGHHPPLRSFVRLSVEHRWLAFPPPGRMPCAPTSVYSVIQSTCWIAYYQH